MQNKNLISLVLGTLLLALIIAGIYQSKTTQDVKTPKPVVIENRASGSVILSESITQFAVDGPDGLVSVDLDKGTGQLPVGEYRVSVWQAERTDGQDNTWMLTGRHYGAEGSFEVTDGSRTNLDVGEPIVAVVHGSRIGPKSYSFSQSLQGRLNESITLTRNGSRPGAPNLRIKNKDGSYDRVFAFRYG